jgi:hypothetical protein
VSDWTWDEPQEFEGWFWRPGENERFYGRLQHDPVSGSSVHFFDAPTIDPLELTPLLPVGGLLLGELPGEVPVTLEGFFPERWTSVSGQSTGEVDGFAQTVYRGCHLDDRGLVADRAEVDLVGLDDALVGVLRDTGILHPGAGQQIGRLREGAQLDVVLKDGAELTMWAEEQGTTSGWSSTTTLRTAVSVALSSAIPAEHLESEYVEPLRQFVVFSTRSTSSTRRLSYARSSSGEAVDTLGQPWPTVRRPRRLPGKLTLNLRRIKDPSLCVTRWFSLRQQVGPVWQLLFAVLGRDDGLIEDRFLNLMAFAEGYHRALRDSPPLTSQQAKAARDSVKHALKGHPTIVREAFNRSLSHANSQSQRERLVDLSHDAVAVLGAAWELDVDEECRVMVDTRNWMTHWGGRTRRVVDHAAGLGLMVHRLELILYASVLHDLRLRPAEVTESIFYGWQDEGFP